MVAALFVRRRSHYLALGCDCYDVDRDARTYCGSAPVVAHPPCRSWGRLAHLAKPRVDERELAFFAVDQVRRCGGVLEHPEGSRLWREAGLPRPGSDQLDIFGGFSVAVDQVHFGHRARKRTWLYVVGFEGALPPVPMPLAAPSVTVEHMGRAERERTPPLFAAWLVGIAAISSPPGPELHKLWRAGGGAGALFLVEGCT